MTENQEPEAGKTDKPAPMPAPVPKPMNRAELYTAVMQTVAPDLAEMDEAIGQAKVSDDTEGLAALLLARAELRLRGIITAEQVRNLSSVLMSDALGGLAAKLQSLPGSRRSPVAAVPPPSDDQG